MNRVDTALDAKQLKLFLAVFNTLSLTVAAEHLGVTQSAVSYALDRLRLTLNDPLFVRSGRGIVATRYSELIKPKIETILNLMRQLPANTEFSPEHERGEIIIAANDYLRDLLLPQLHKKLRQLAPSLSLNIIPCSIEDADLIRSEAVDFLLTPKPPIKDDIFKVQVFSDRQALFYDAQYREAPTCDNDILNASLLVPHLTVQEPQGLVTLPLAGKPTMKPAVILHSLAGLPLFLKDTDMLALLPASLSHGLMQSFAMHAIAGLDDNLPVHLCWHKRDDQTPLNHWIRGLLYDIAKTLNASTDSAGH